MASATRWPLFRATSPIGCHSIPVACGRTETRNAQTPVIRKCALFWLISLATVVTARADTRSIQVQVSPDVRPLKDSANITVGINGSEKRPARPVDLSIRLTAPPPGGLVSTDFPLIEGTPLIVMDLSGVPGTLSWDYVFPIRGVYRLDVTATDEEGHRWDRTFEIRIHENRAKVVFLISFTAALFILGVVAGRLFTGLAGRAGFFVISLFIGLGASLGMISEPRGDHGAIDRAGALKSTLTVTKPKVGSLSTIQWRGTDPVTDERVPAVVALTIIQLEKGKEIFRLNRLPTGGSLDTSFQFTDASPHRVIATAVAPEHGHVVDTVKTVHVDSATPSLPIRLRPVLLFMLVVTAGLAAGRISKEGGLRCFGRPGKSR